MSWKNDFTAVAGELAGAVEQLGESGTSFTDAWRDRLTASNTISESDFLSLYADQSPEVRRGGVTGLPRRQRRPGIRSSSWLMPKATRPGI